MKKSFFKNKGFTLIELIIAVSIFVFMTAYLLTKYGTFSQGILLTNLAYDVALTIRNAQSYGLNVRGIDIGESQGTEYKYPYGVHFSSESSYNKLFTLFADTSVSDGIYQNDTNISITNIKRGSYISKICFSSSSCASGSPFLKNRADITFKRPFPNAIIKYTGDASTAYPYVEITLTSTDGSTKRVTVRSTGQITIKD